MPTASLHLIRSDTMTNYRKRRRTRKHYGLFESNCVPVLWALLLRPKLALSDFEKRNPESWLLENCMSTTSTQVSQPSALRHVVCMSIETQQILVHPRSSLFNGQPMQSSMRKVLTGAAIFAVSTVLAVIGYWLAGWSLLEAVYMVIITIYGVGYGEVRPIDEPRLKVFTIGVIIAGCTSAIYVLGGFVQMIAEGEFNRVLGARRMTRGIEKLTGHAIICGYGRVGRILAKELAEAKHSFVLVDTNHERLREAEDSGLFVLIGDATDERVLESAGARKARVLATVLPDDAKNVFITLTARELNDELEIIARGELPSTEKKLLRSGATRVVLPAAIGASRIARLITRPSAEQLLSSGNDYETMNLDLKQIGLQISEFDVPSASHFVGHPVADLAFGNSSQFVIVAVRHRDRSVTRNPDPNVVIRPDDTLIVLAEAGAVAHLKQRVNKSELVYRGSRA